MCVSAEFGSCTVTDIKCLDKDKNHSLRILSLRNCALTPRDMPNVKTITRAGVLVNVTGNMLNCVSSPRSSQKIIGLGEQKEYIPVKHKKGKKTKRQKKGKQNKRGHRTKGRNR